MKVFISYSHQQEEWVLDRLAPCLACAGVEVFIDCNRIEAGKKVGPQLDGSQDQCDKQILVFSPAYFKSKWCLGEMERALERNHQTGQELIVPVIRENTPVPPALSDTVYVDLVDDRRENEWEKLLATCKAELGMPAPLWFQKRDELREGLRQNQSVNLVIERPIDWKSLLYHLEHPNIPDKKIPEFRKIDLNAGATDTRRGLVETIVQELGGAVDISPDRELAVLDRFIKRREGLSRIEIQHMEIIQYRPDYDVNLFSALCHLVDERRLNLFMISRTALLDLLPAGDPRYNEVSSLATRCKKVSF